MNAYLLSIGDLENCTVCLDKAVRAIVDSPYTDKSTIHGNFVESRESSHIIEEFYRYSSLGKKDSVIRALHFIITGDGSPLPTDFMAEAAELVITTLEICGRQGFAVRHTGSETYGLGEHYHFIVSPEQMFRDEEFVPSYALCEKMIYMLNWRTHVHWTHKYCYTRCFRQAAENTYAEVYNPAEILYFH